MNDEAREAIRMIEDEAALADTHDIGQEGASRLRAATLILRRVLWGAFCLSLAACTQPSAPSTPLTGIPAVSEAVIQPEEGRAALAVATPVPFDCKAYAMSLLPWKGPFPSPIFDAVSDALLPDSQEFAQRRAEACVVLAVQKGN